MKGETFDGTEFDAYKDTPMTYGTEEASVITIIVKRGTEENENELTLFPHINNTDGFFISLFKRK